MTEPFSGEAHSSTRAHVGEVSKIVEQAQREAETRAEMRHGARALRPAADTNRHAEAAR
jgi:hypothetical protein